MKQTNRLAVALFAASALVGSLLIGSGVFAQSTTVSSTASTTASSTAATQLSCSPNTVSAAVGQSVTLTASGGNGTYAWSSPGLTIANPNGKSFNVTFNRAGTFPVTVSSAGMNATCDVTVAAAATGATGTTGTTGTTTPGLPNTGELPE
ncbi:MAG: hypothetical protein KGJ13_02880 [Patescibacteria group bacterium]|nr:hypothetical protein [Patescibacteria group bacterium]